MMSMINNCNTDKHTVHSYLELYEKLLQSKKLTAKCILEIGIGKGGSIRLWYDYFPNAHIYGVDLEGPEAIWDKSILEQDRITLYTGVNAYDETFFRDNLLNQNIQFDLILDDGAHTLDSMIKVLQMYCQLLTNDGILIIEDIQDIQWVDILKQHMPAHLKQYVKEYDLRSNKGRYDDIVLVIDKQNKHKILRLIEI